MPRSIPRIREIINANFGSIDETVLIFKGCSKEDVGSFLDVVIKAWKSNELTILDMLALLQAASIFLDRLEIDIAYRNITPIPVCCFSPFLPVAASLIGMYLKVSSLSSRFFHLQSGDKELRDYLEKNRPAAIIFTISQFPYIENFKCLVSYLKGKKIQIFAGGIAFLYALKSTLDFPDCIFPASIKELIRLLEKIAWEAVM